MTQIEPLTMTGMVEVGNGVYAVAGGVDTTFLRHLLRNFRGSIPGRENVVQLFLWCRRFWSGGRLF